MIDGPHAGDSNIATAKTLAAPVPIDDLAATGGDREITLTFSPPTAATSVKVKIWDPIAALWVDATTAAPITADATSATVIGLADDTYYYFYMEVVGGPRRGVSNTAGASTNPASSVSSPIADLTATGGDRTVTLNFSSPAGATSVTLKQRVSGETTWIDATTTSPLDSSSASAVVTGLLDDTEYEFYLEVVGGSHEGDSNIASARTTAASVVDSIAPEWPAASELVLSDITQSTMKLSWPQASDNVAVKGYRIYIDGHQEVDHESADFAYSVTDHVYSYTISGLTPSTTYQITVKAYDASNNVSEPGLSHTATTKAPPTDSSESRSSSPGYIPFLSDNADLKLLEIQTAQGDVALTPSFKPEITEYTVETTADSIELLAEADHRWAKIEYQEQTLDEEAVVIHLQPGENVIKLVVKAEDRSSKTYTLTIIKIAPTSEEQDAMFRDTAGHWAEHLIAEAVSEGLVEGYPDGTFKPNQPVTRAEFLVLLVRTLQLDGEGAELAFTDLHEIGNWAAGSIRLAVEASIVEGYSDGSFQPNRSITRAEAAVMIARALELTAEDDQETQFADDDSIPHWAKGAIETLRKLGIVNGRSDNRFDPFASTTRAEAVVMLQRMLD